MKAVGLSILLMCAYAFGADAKSASIVDSVSVTHAMQYWSKSSMSPVR